MIRTLRFFVELILNLFVPAQIAHIKERFNVTTIVRGRKDKVGKVSVEFQYEDEDEHGTVAGLDSNARIQQ
jgi:hypothetical protein